MSGDTLSETIYMEKSPAASEIVMEPEFGPKYVKNRHLS